MARPWVGFPLILLALTFNFCQGQTSIPAPIPELKYPAIARLAGVQGDVVISFRRTPEGGTAEVTAVSGPAMLQVTAVENVKAWHFTATTDPAGHVHKVTFHFQLDSPSDGYDTQPTTKVDLDGEGRVRVLSILATGLERTECPTAGNRDLPYAVVGGDFVEVQRWNEDVRVNANGAITWVQGKVSRSGHMSSIKARSLLERFRTQSVWSLCGSYYQGGLMDGDGSSIKLRIGGRDKSVREYGDVAPPIFREVELAVDGAADTHQWRHGNPKSESIIEIAFEYLPKPGKTRLMDAAHRGDKAGVEAALAAGDKVTDADTSGWTPLMYAAGSYGSSVVHEMLEAGAEVNARSKRGETALMASAATGVVDEDLLNASPDVNAVNDVGMTSLMLLSQRGNPDQISALLKAGANARMKDAEGRTALDYLNAANCRSAIVQEKDPRWMTASYSSCNVLNSDEFQQSTHLLFDAGARATRVAAPDGMLMP